MYKIFNIIIFIFFITNNLLGNGFTKIWTEGYNSYSYSISAGDYDNDGDMDILVGNSYSPNFIYNNENGKYVLVWEDFEDYGTMSVNWGDYDGDGDLDFIICNWVDKSNDTPIIVYKNNGKNNFSKVWEQEYFSYDGESVYSMAAWGDYNNDGLLDFLVVSENDDDTATNRIYKNIGNDSFSNIFSFPGEAVNCSWGDYNNDGYLDFALLLSDSVKVYLSQSGTNFTEIYSDALFINSGNGGGIAFGDYNKDNYLDLFVSSDSGVKVYSNVSGTGTFVKVWTNIAISSFAYKIALADYNNDGYLDLSCANIDSPFMIYYYNKNTIFSNGYINSFITRAYDLKAADMDNDGNIDLLLGNSGAANMIFRNDNNFNIITVWTSAHYNAFSSESLAVSDFDNDGYIDIFICNYSRTNFILKNNKNSTFSVIWRSATKAESKSVQVEDYNSDGYADILVADDSTNNSVKVYKNIGNFNFTNVFTDNLDNSYSAGWGDYDNDGDSDFIVSTASSNIIYENLGGDNFVRVISFPAESGKKYVRWVDYDNDGDLDVCVATSKGEYTFYRNNGNKTFTDPANLYEIDFGDYDNDGDLDLLISSSGGVNKIFKNEGEAFVLAWSSDETELSLAAKWVDVDNDGDLDIFVGNVYGYDRFYKNINGDFKPDWVNNIKDATYALAIADIDNNGVNDFISAGHYSSIKIYKNLGLNSANDILPNNPIHMISMSNMGETAAGNGIYKFKYTIADNESDFAKLVKVEYSVDKKAYKYADISGDVDNISTSKTGETHYFTWDSSVVSRDLIAGKSLKLKINFISYFGNNNNLAVKSSGPIVYNTSSYVYTFNLNLDGFPQCKITTPVSINTPYDKVSGKVNIYGYAYDYNLEKYVLYYGEGTTPSTWHGICTNYYKVAPFEELGVWDTSLLSNGVYSLRIVAYDITGKIRDSWSNVVNRVRVEVFNKPAAASEVEFSYPTNNQNNVARNTPIIIRFTDKINPTTITPDTIKLYDGDNYVDGIITYNDFARSIIFTPNTALDGFKDYIVLVDSEVQNIYGVPLGNIYSFKFKTHSLIPDNINSVAPYPSKPDTPLTTDISINYNSGVLSDINFTNNLEVFPVVRTPAPAFEFKTFLSNYTAVYSNQTVLQDNMIYVVTLKPEITDNKGYYTWFFVTRDTIAPEIDFNNTYPEPDSTFVDINTKITIRFNKSMNINMLSTNTIFLSGNNKKVDSKITYSESEKEVYITPLAPLVQDTVYTVFVSKELRDFWGKQLDKNYQWNFRTGVVINRDGGRLSTTDNRFIVVIPPHSLNNNTSIQIKKLAETDIPNITDNKLRIVPGYAYNMGPDVKLNKPVTVKINYNDNDLNGFSENKLALYLYHNNKWMRIGGTVNKTENRIYGVVYNMGIVVLMEDSNSYTGDLKNIRIECQPRVFVPEDFEQTAISFSLPEPLKYSVKVFSLSGRLVKILADNVLGNYGQNVLFWDGTDYNNELLPNRIYFVSVIVYNGNKIFKKTKTVVILSK